MCLEIESANQTIINLYIVFLLVREFLFKTLTLIGQPVKAMKITSLRILFQIDIRFY